MDGRKSLTPDSTDLNFKEMDKISGCPFSVQSEPNQNSNQWVSITAIYLLPFTEMGLRSEAILAVGVQSCLVACGSGIRPTVGVHYRNQDRSQVQPIQIKPMSVLFGDWVIAA